MASSYYVNILNEGVIPWIRQTGPLFGYTLTEGVLSILKKDPRINIELTTPEDAKAKYLEYITKKKAEAQKKIDAVKMAEKIDLKDSLEIKVEKKPDEPVVPTEVTKPVEPDPIDKAIDNVIAESDSKSVFEKESLTKKPSAPANKKYSDEELSKLTKDQMAKILRDRGYVEGQYHPRYHDNRPDLIKKIKITQ